MLQASLKVVGGTHVGEVIPLGQPKFLIGRENDCHLRPNSEAISRHHCAFTIDDYAVRLRDLGSTNGTYVNGERLRGVAALNSGDLVTVGKLEFAIIIGEEVAAAIQDGVEPTLNNETVEMAADETAYELPAINAPPAAVQESNTTMLPAMNMPPGQQHPQQPYPQQPMGMPYQYPQQPGYYPPGMAYPGQQPMSGYYPQYPYPYPQPVVMGQPYPQQGAPANMPAPAPETASAKNSAPDVQLPDPSTTGIQPSTPPADPPQGTAAPGDAGKNPSQHAADIIRGQRHRRPE